jgi:hypothetical protein
MHTFVAVDEVGRELAEKVGAAPSAGHADAVTWAREVERLPTVQNPYSRGVDATTGRLFIAGLSGGSYTSSVRRLSRRVWGLRVHQCPY